LPTVQPPAGAGDHAVEFRGVAKSYGSVEVVRALDLEVGRGELVTLLGPSGSGKTTTLMMAAGFVTPDGGRILLDGRDVTRTPPQRRNIGVVFQNYALFPHRTVAENIAFPLRVRGVPAGEQRRRVAEALDLVRLGGYDRRYPRELSGGQQQRVALARALVFNPPVLLMDEPLGALDKNLRKEMELELREMQQRLKVTMVYVTHDQEEALALSDRVAVMRDGRIEQCADPESIYTKPRNVFVATFIGDMNILFGAVQTEPERRFQMDAGPSAPAPEAAWARAGTRCALGVRPEHVEVRSAGAPGPRADAGLPATVAGAVYLGDAWFYDLALRGGGVLRAKQPAGRGTRRFAPGSAVTAGWHAADAVLLEA
jgi:putative spermidine/putrescine transport system ATP-binding protein